MTQAAKHFGDTSTWKTFRRCFCMKCEFKFAYFTVQTKAAKHTVGRGPPSQSEFPIRHWLSNLFVHHSFN
jgi:hypothetical protein